MKQPHINDFINYNHKVGPLQAMSVGFPGSGKSNQASYIVTRCIQDRKTDHYNYKGEMGLMHGDIACEWRHYLNFSQYVKGVILVLPEQVDIAFVPGNIKKLFSNYKVPVEIKGWDYAQGLPHLTETMKPNHITVIYDQCFNDIDRTRMWSDFAKQLFLREKYYQNAITYLCHESHEIFPQTASGEQWKAIQDFASSFAFWRKRKVRALLLAHQETEVFDRIRKKCYWKIYRDAYPTNAFHRAIVKAYVFRMAIHKYHLFYGNVYVPLRQNIKMKEISQDWLMIPRDLIELNGGVETQQASAKHPSEKVLARIIKKIYAETESKRKTADFLGIDYSTVDRRLKSSVNKAII